MIAKNFKEFITENGDYRFPTLNPGKKVLLELDGDFGGGSCTIGYVGYTTGTFVAIRDSAGAQTSSSVAAGWVVIVPTSGRLAVSLTGATSPSLSVAFLDLKSEDRD